MKKQWVVLAVLMTILAGCCGGPVCQAQEAEQAEQAEQAPPQIKLYEGEITDEMITSFLRADAKIRSIRQQIAQVTEKVLTDENIKAEVYMAIAQKMRQDTDFLEKVRAAAATLVAESTVPEDVIETE